MVRDIGFIQNKKYGKEGRVKPAYITRAGGTRSRGIVLINKSSKSGDISNTPRGIGRVISHETMHIALERTAGLKASEGLDNLDYKDVRGKDNWYNHNDPFRRWKF